jgi:hypothetical protein
MMDVALSDERALMKAITGTPGRCARRERPCRRRTAEHRDEIAAPHARSSRPYFQ